MDMHYDKDLMSVAKRAIETGVASVSRQFILKRLDDFAEARRQPGQTFQQSYARYLESPEGQLLYKASKVARFSDDTRAGIVGKALHDDLTIDTVSKRMVRQASILKESAPYMSDRECMEKVLASNPGARELIAAEIGEPVDKTAARGASADPSRRLIRAAEGMVRRGSVSHINDGIKAVKDANPGLHRAALAEFDNDTDDMTGDDDVGKGVVEFRKGTMARRVTDVVRSDARARLEAAAQRIVDAGGARDFDHAFRLAIIRNPELAACLPDVMADTWVDVSDTYPNRVDTRPRTESMGGNRIRKPYD